MELGLEGVFRFCVEEDGVVVVFPAVFDGVVGHHGVVYPGDVVSVLGTSEQLGEDETHDGDGAEVAMPVQGACRF